MKDRQRPLVAKALAVCLMLTLCTVTSACAHKNQPEKNPETLVEDSLRDACDRISADLARLSGSTQSLATGSPGSELSRKMRMDFDGPLVQALEKVCAAAGYRLSVVGRARPVPVIVHVHAHKTILEILRDIGLQTGPHERLRVVEQARLVELVWLEPDVTPKPTANKKRGGRS